MQASRLPVGNPTKWRRRRPPTSAGWAASTGDFARFTVLDDQMHAWLFDTAGMGRLWSAIHVKKAHLDRIRFLHVPEPGKIRQVAEQHVAILDAIAAGDRATTEVRVREHTSGSVLYLETLPVERPELFDSLRLSRAKPGTTEGSAPAQSETPPDGQRRDPGPSGALEPAAHSCH